MKEKLVWSDLCKTPQPQWMLSVFWRVLISFWKQELDPSLDHPRLPLTMEEVVLKLRPDGFFRRKYHIYSLSNSEKIGIWDESPFDISFSTVTKKIIPFYEHGIHHALSSLLKDVGKNMEEIATYDPQFPLVQKVLSKSPVLNYRCRTCSEVVSWIHGFLDSEYRENKISVAPSVVMFLLRYKNKRREASTEINRKQCLDVMEKALHSFLSSFFQIQEQTTMDPILLLQGLIDVLDRKDCTFENLGEKELECSQEMRSFLLTTLKFIKTKSIQVQHFPRLLIIARESFLSLVQTLPIVDQVFEGSVGHLLLMNFLCFEDRALSSPPTTKDSIVFYREDGSMLSERLFSEEECARFTDYHPLLRHSLFDNDSG